MSPARKILAVLLVAIPLAACTPVMDPGKWDSGQFCRTTHTAWCKAHGH
jgi:hypothetical protein